MLQSLKNYLIVKMPLAWLLLDIIYPFADRQAQPIYIKGRHRAKEEEK